MHSKYLTKMEHTVGGGEGVEGTYGTISPGGMDKIFQTLKRCGLLHNDTVFCDVGCGLMRPALQLVAFHKIRKAWGFDFEKIKVNKAISYVQNVATYLRDKGGGEASANNTASCRAEGM